MSTKKRTNGEDVVTQTTNFDTLKAAKVLQDAGVPDEQAEAQVSWRRAFARERGGARLNKGSVHIVH